MSFLKMKYPNRNFNKKPMSLKEREKFSKEYIEETDVPELSSKDSTVALDFFMESGGGLKRDRHYTQLPLDTMSNRK